MRGHLLPLSGLALLGLTLAACTDFARPEPLSISAEPVIVAPRPEKAEPVAAAAPAEGAAPAAPRPAPPARPAAAKSGGG